MPHLHPYSRMRLAATRHRPRELPVLADAIPNARRILINVNNMDRLLAGGSVALATGTLAILFSMLSGHSSSGLSPLSRWQRRRLASPGPGRSHGHAYQCGPARTTLSRRMDVMKDRRVLATFAIFALPMTACEPSAASGTHAPARTTPLAHWAKFMHIPEVVDLASRGRGSLFVAAAGRLFTLKPGGALKPYARGPGGYATAHGPEAYIAVTGGERVTGTRCSFGSGTIFALEPTRNPGVIKIGTNGKATRFANVPAGGQLTAIAFDSTGHFGHDLLVADRSRSGTTTILAFGCTGRDHVVTRRAPALEGGMAVAPASFGKYGGDLVAP